MDDNEVCIQTLTGDYISSPHSQLVAHSSNWLKIVTVWSDFETGILTNLELDPNGISYKTPTLVINIIIIIICVARFMHEMQFKVTLTLTLL